MTLRQVMSYGMGREMPGKQGYVKIRVMHWIRRIGSFIAWLRRGALLHTMPTSELSVPLNREQSDSLAQGITEACPRYQAFPPRQSRGASRFY